MISYVFKRYELKYLLTQKQYLKVRDEIEKRLLPDVFGKTVIQSLYYDTADDRLVRASNEKPVFKEKLRLRAYGLSDSSKDVYIEMKRKYDGIVYKRRIACKEDEVADIFSGKCPDSQVGKELEYFIRFYGKLSPRMLILYDREAFTDKNSDLRVTFDKNVRYRMTDLNMHTSLDGKALLPEGTVLMELKAGAAFPLWLCEMLCREGIKKQSFSKYGAAYEREHAKTTKSILSRSEILCLNPFSVTEASLLSTSSSL